MNDAVLNKSTALTAALLTYYGTEGTRLSVRVRLLARWLKLYPEPWVRAALIESIYQGRYKTVSVEQLLERWQRRGQPSCHFNSEFARFICQNIPRELARFPDEKRDHGFSRKFNYRDLTGAYPEQDKPSPPETPPATVFSAVMESATTKLLIEQSSCTSANVDEHQPQDELVAIAQSTTNSAFLGLPGSEGELHPEAESKLTEAGESKIAAEASETGRAFVPSGIESIHPFILEDEFDEFCEKLLAIASQPR